MVDSSLSCGQPNARNLPHLGIVDIPRDGLPSIMGIQPTIVILWDVMGYINVSNIDISEY